MVSGENTFKKLSHSFDGPSTSLLVSIVFVTATIPSPRILMVLFNRSGSLNRLLLSNTSQSSAKFTNLSNVIRPTDVLLKATNLAKRTTGAAGTTGNAGAAGATCGAAAGMTTGMTATGGKGAGTICALIGA